MKNIAIIAALCIFALSMYLLGRKERNKVYEMKQKQLSEVVSKAKVEKEGLKLQIENHKKTISELKKSAADRLSFAKSASHKQLDSLHYRIITRRSAVPIPIDTAIKCIPYSEFRELVADASLVPLLDSIIMMQGAEIGLHYESEAKSDTIISTLTEQLELCEKEVWWAKTWSTVKKWALIILPPLALVIGYVIGQK